LEGNTELKGVLMKDVKIFTFRGGKKVGKGGGVNN